MGKKLNLESLSDTALLRRVSELVKQTRADEADLIAHIGEVDARRLHARQAVPSLFAWCTEILRFSEQEAYARITAARASRKHPMLLEMLRDGRLHLSGIVRLAPHLTLANRQAVLKRATHRSKRQIEELVAELEPKPDAKAKIRKLPERRATAHSATGHGLPPAFVGRASGGPGSRGAAGGEVRPDPGASDRRLPGLRLDTLAGSGPQLCPGRVAASPKPALSGSGRVEPLAPARYRVQFTASAELRDKLERLRALMRSSVPDGDLAEIIDQAVTEKLERLESKRFGKTRRPRKGLAGVKTTPSSRHIPAPIRRAVYERDGGRCTFVDRQGRRCTARKHLEFHHDDPYGRGGVHSLKNLRLVCRTHNVHLAECDYGKDKMAHYWSSGGRVSEAAVYTTAKRDARGHPLPP
jgi:5-methylcytosine-specific restriction endonuclease McrA